MAETTTSSSSSNNSSRDGLEACGLDENMQQVGAGSAAAQATTPTDRWDRLVQRQRSDLMYELRKLEHGDKPVTGKGARKVVENFLEESLQPAHERRPRERKPDDPMVLEVRGVFERKRVSSVLQSQEFKRDLENAIRGTIVRQEREADKARQHQEMAAAAIEENWDTLSQSSYSSAVSSHSSNEQLLFPWQPAPSQFMQSHPMMGIPPPPPPPNPQQFAPMMQPPQYRPLAAVMQQHMTSRQHVSSQQHMPSQQYMPSQSYMSSQQHMPSQQYMPYQQHMPPQQDMSSQQHMSSQHMSSQQHMPSQQYMPSQQHMSSQRYMPSQQHMSSQQQYMPPQFQQRGPSQMPRPHQMAPGQHRPSPWLHPQMPQQLRPSSWQQRSHHMQGPMQHGQQRLNSMEAWRQAQREELVFEISDLVHRRLVSQTLDGDFRGHLEIHMQDRVADGQIGSQVSDFVHSLRSSTPFRRNDFSHLGIQQPEPVNAAYEGDMNPALMSLKQELEELKTMVRMNFEMQLDIQRAIRQEVSAALATIAGGSAEQQTVPLQATSSQAIEHGNCLICLDRAVDSVLYQCGHMCVCTTCGLRLKGQGLNCPLCRAPIRDVIRAYKCVAEPDEDDDADESSASALQR